jgi:hypothetical protein
MKLSALVVGLLGVSMLLACKEKRIPAFSFNRCDGSAGFQHIQSPTLCGTSQEMGGLVLGAVVRGTNLVVEMTNHEVGTKLSAGSIKPREHSDATGSHSRSTWSTGDLVAIPIGNKLASITLEELKGQHVELGVILTLDSPRHGTVNVMLPPISVASAFYDPATAEHLLVQQKLGLDATAPAKHSVYIASRGYVLGDARSLAEVDWVALPTLAARDESETCAYETEQKQRMNVAKSVEVYTVKLVDRRTGQVIETKDFHAVGECPGFISSSDIRIDFNGASWKAVETWLVEKMAGS